MKTSALRNAISIALFATLSGNAGIALAREPAPDTARADAERQDGAGQGSTTASTPSKPASQPEATATELETVTVTGTRIRGGSTPSPVIAIGSEQIRQEGFADLGEVVRSLPQNFNGGQNPGVGSGGFSGAGIANQNVTGGSSLNLRGLGPDATLTLLNGRRMAYSGFAQAVDISAIPVDAVERVEIVADGASAIYGSDAVGGVGNVILRRDYDGVAVSGRYGRAGEGGLATREYTVTGGSHWGSGGLIAAYRDASIDPIYAAQRDYTAHLGPPTTIYPGSRQRSAVLSAHQALGEWMELRLDALRSRRDQHHYYDFLGINRMTPQTTTTLVSPGIDLLLPGDWTLSLGGAWAKDQHDERQMRENPTTGVITPIVNDCYCNESRTYELGVEGPLLALEAGEVRIAAGAGYRTNAFNQYSLATGARVMQGSESARFAYAEIDVPLVGPRQELAGIWRLALTAAMRGEDYSSFGNVATPKFGLVYGPNADFTVKASWGKSFKAPTLLQINQGRVAQLSFPRNFGGTGYASQDTALRVGGGNPSLDPERARTWTASVAYHPEALPGLEMELTGFNIDYTNRVVQPIVNYAQVMRNPAFADFISYQPSAEELQRVLSTVRFVNSTGLPYDPGRVVAIIYGNYVNVARQRIKGMDLSGGYRFELGSGRLAVRGMATWLDSTQQSSTTQHPFDLSGTLFNPARFSGRFGTVWEQGGFSASVFANYTAGVVNTVDRRKSASSTTLDTTLRYAIGRGGAWSGIAVTLSAQNLFDRAPPLYTPNDYAEYALPYDATNYSAIGRFVSLAVSKHF
jgi:iron complex outermembrane receptor protein